VSVNKEKIKWLKLLSRAWLGYHDNILILYYLRIFSLAPIVFGLIVAVPAATWSILSNKWFPLLLPIIISIAILLMVKSPWFCKWFFKPVMFNWDIYEKNRQKYILRQIKYLLRVGRISAPFKYRHLCKLQSMKYAQLGHLDTIASCLEILVIGAFVHGGFNSVGSYSKDKMLSTVRIGYFKILGEGKIKLPHSWFSRNPNIFQKDIHNIFLLYREIENEIFNTKCMLSHEKNDTKSEGKENSQEDRKIDHINFKLIELYQLANIEGKKPPSYERIADVIYRDKLTKTRYTKQAIQKRVKKLKEKGLIGPENDNHEPASIYDPSNLDNMPDQIKRKF